MREARSPIAPQPAARNPWGAGSRGTAEDLERVRFVTRNFGRLQGLRGKIPLGLALLLCGVGEILPYPFGYKLALALLPGPFLIQFLAKRYYLRRFGQVEGPDVKSRIGRKMRLAAAAALLGWIFGHMFAHVSPLRDPRTFYVGCGAALIWLWTEMGRGPSLLYYPILASLALAVGAPSRTFGYLLPPMGRLGPCCIFVGFTLLLAGLLDHRQLVRAVARFARPAEELDHETLAEEAR